MFTEEEIKRIDSLFAEYDSLESPGCCVAVIKDGKVGFLKGYGSANLEYRVPINEDTVFHVASVSKQFTAMAVALLEERGHVSVADDIRQYIPELPEYPHKVTVGDLIYMTNGLFDLYGLMGYIRGVRENDYFSKAEAWQAIKACDWLMFEPGTSWSYGNTGYFLLAELVERISGKPLAEFAHTNIFQPLGMDSTFFRDDRTKIIQNRAESYSEYAHVHFGKEGPKYSTRDDKFSINADQLEIPGAGQVWTTVTDMAKWDANFSNNKLGKGSPDLIRKICTSGKLKSGQSVNYGYGLYINQNRGLDYVSHTGWANGNSSIIHRLPGHGLSVIALGNLTSLFWKLEVYPGSDCAVDKIIELVLGKDKYPPPLESCALVGEISKESWDDVQDLVGWYQDERSLVCELAIDPRGLVYRDLCEREIPLLRQGGEYRSKDGGMVCRPCNQGLEITMQGNTTVFTPFISKPQGLTEYFGTYHCPKINTCFEISASEKGLTLKNQNLRDTAVDIAFAPTIKDSFLAQEPPYCPWYVLSFLRNGDGIITGFVFRDDEGRKRENLVFERVSL